MVVRQEQPRPSVRTLLSRNSAVLSNIIFSNRGCLNPAAGTAQSAAEMFKKLGAKLSRKHRHKEHDASGVDQFVAIASTSATASTNQQTASANHHPTIERMEPVEVDPKALDTYSYTTLPTPTSFRLLEFGRSDVEFTTYGQQKICRLVTHELADAPPYLCLSYTWATPVDTERHREAFKGLRTWVLAPTADSPAWTSIDVGLNLYTALKQILGSERTISHIWIDALCINQNDLAERAAQVTIITQIYSLCTRTIAWLGENSIDTISFFTLHLNTLPPFAMYIKEHSNQNDWDEENFYDRLGLREGSCNWKSYAKFYRERTFFGRSWIFQELCLTKDLIMMMGPNTIRLNEMALLAELLRSSGLGVSFLLSLEDDAHDGNKTADPAAAQSDLVPHLELPGTSAMTFNRLRTRCTGIGTRKWLQAMAEETGTGGALESAAYLFFATVILQMRPAKATDPRDKIFAAYGFLKKALAPLGIEPRIRPDYTKSVQEVYIEVTSLLLGSSPDFGILSDCQRPAVTSISNLPSWVPDFAAEHTSLFASSHFSRRNASLVPTPRGPPAASLFTIDARSLPTPTLTLRSSHAVDTVARLAVPPPSSSSSDPDSVLYMKHVVEEWRFLLSQLRHGGDTSTAAVTNQHCDWPTLVTTVTAGCLADERLDKYEGATSGVTAANFKAFVLVFPWTLHSMLPKVEEEEGLKGAAEGVEYQALQDDDFSSMWEDDSKRYPAYIPSKEEMHAWLSSCQKVSDGSHHPGSDDFAASRTQTRADANFFIIKMSTVEFGRTLFVTAEGRLGLGPKSLQHGDEILLVKGARMVFAVREIPVGECERADGDGGGGPGKRYRMIGECYLHGVMNGELVESIIGESWGPVTLV